MSSTGSQKEKYLFFLEVKHQLSHVSTTPWIQLVFKRSTVTSLISLEVEKSLKKSLGRQGVVWGWCLQLHWKVPDTLFFQSEAIHILFSIMFFYVLRWQAHSKLQSKNKNGRLYKLQHKKQPNGQGTIKETSLRFSQNRNKSSVERVKKRTKDHVQFNRILLEEKEN